MKTITWLISIGLFSSTSEMINFDRAALGKMPTGWVSPGPTSPASRWQVVRDTSAPSQPYVLAQVAGDQDKTACPMALLERPSIRDGELSVRFKPVSGNSQRDGGLVWRYRDPFNYYLVRADAMQKNIAVYKVQNGQTIQLMGRAGHAQKREIQHDVPTNYWSTLRIVFKGPQFSVFYNHRRILQGEDSGFTGSGKIGLWTKADSVTYFDDFKYIAK